MQTPEEIVFRLLEGDVEDFDPVELVKGASWWTEPNEFLYVKHKKVPSPPWGEIADRDESFQFDVHWKRQASAFTGKPIRLGTISVSHDRKGNPVWTITYLASHLGFFENNLLDRKFTSRYEAARKILALHKSELKKFGTLDRVMSGG